MSKLGAPVERPQPLKYRRPACDCDLPDGCYGSQGVHCAYDPAYPGDRARGRVLLTKDSRGRLVPVRCPRDAEAYRQALAEQQLRQGNSASGAAGDDLFDDI